MTEKVYLTVSKVAEKLNLSADTIRRWDKKGLIKSIRDENDYRLFSLEEVKRIQDKYLGLSSERGFYVLKSETTDYTSIELFAGAGGITFTITFSRPIYATGFDLFHINGNGTNGDKYTITATTTSGGTIYPTFTNSSNPSYTSNNATGVVDANKSSTSGTNAMVGINFLDEDYITSVTFLWQNCNTCSEYAIHGSGLGNFSFCLPQTLDFDGINLNQLENSDKKDLDIKITHLAHGLPVGGEWDDL